MADELSPRAGPECQVQAAAVSKRRERSLLALGSSSRPPALGGSESDVEAGWAVRVLDPSWCLLLLRSCVAVFLASMCFSLVFALVKSECRVRDKKVVRMLSVHNEE